MPSYRLLISVSVRKGGAGGAGRTMSRERRDEASPRGRERSAMRGAERGVVVTAWDSAVRSDAAQQGRPRSQRAGQCASGIGSTVLSTSRSSFYLVYACRQAFRYRISALRARISEPEIATELRRSSRPDMSRRRPFPRPVSPHVGHAQEATPPPFRQPHYVGNFVQADLRQGSPTAALPRRCGGRRATGAS